MGRTLLKATRDSMPGFAAGANGKTNNNETEPIVEGLLRFE
jgi:hypothetical protein